MTKSNSLAEKIGYTLLAISTESVLLSQSANAAPKVPTPNQALRELRSCQGLIDSTFVADTSLQKAVICKNGKKLKEFAVSTGTGKTPSPHIYGYFGHKVLNGEMLNPDNDQSYGRFQFMGEIHGKIIRGFDKNNKPIYGRNIANEGNLVHDGSPSRVANKLFGQPQESNTSTSSPDIISPQPKEYGLSKGCINIKITDIKEYMRLNPVKVIVGNSLTIPRIKQIAIQNPDQYQEQIAEAEAFYKLQKLKDK